MNPPHLLQAALALFESNRTARTAPRIALLGPDGCGHVEFLDELCKRLAENPALSDDRHLRISLDQIVVSTTDDMYAQLARELLGAARATEMNVPEPASPCRGGVSFAALLEQLVAGVEGRLIIHLENFDGVPRFFARSVNRALRACFESENRAPSVNRLGVVATGTISLFELKHEADSAFQSFTAMTLPESNRLGRAELLRVSLARLQREPPNADAIEMLVDLTGGEVAFLAPLLASCTDYSQPEALRSAAESLVWADAPLPILSDIGFHIQLDAELRQVVSRLLDSHDPVIPRSAIGDIDRYQLMGVVIRPKESQHVGYRFRNEVVRGFVQRLLDPASAARQGSGLSLEQLLQAATTTVEQDVLAELLLEAWHVTTGRSCPEASLSVTLGMGGASDGPSLTTGDPQDQALTAAASAGCRARRRPFFEADSQRLAVATPVRDEEFVASVVVVVPKSSCRGFSEHRLRHWLAFLAQVEVAVVRSLLAALAKSDLRARRTKPPGLSPRSGRDAEQEAILLQRYPALQLRPGHRGTFDAGVDFAEADSMLRTSVGLGHAPADQTVELIADLAQRCGQVVRRVSGLAEQLSNGTAPLVITTEVEGLKVPFELLSVDNAELCLRRPVSRRIVQRRVAASSFYRFTEFANRVIQGTRGLRALVIASDPYADLQHVGDEADLVETTLKRWCAARGVTAEVVVLGPNDANVDAVENATADERGFDIVHFGGHGEGTPAACLVLRDADAQPYEVTASKLKYWLERAKPQLVYLSSCHGGSVSRRAGEGYRYLGAADAVLSAGVSTTVAFRGPVHDASAKNFAALFYGHVFPRSGDVLPPSIAMLNARRQAHASDCTAWALSILITQGAAEGEAPHPTSEERLWPKNT